MTRATRMLAADEPAERPFSDPETHVVLIVSEACTTPARTMSTLIARRCAKPLIPLLDRDDLTPATRQSMAPCRSAAFRGGTILMPASGASPQPADGPDEHLQPVAWRQGAQHLRRRLIAARMPPPRRGSRRVTHVLRTVPACDSGFSGNASR
jgi:hypothetical protein